MAFAYFGRLSGPGAAGRHHLGPLLRRQRRAARLLRRGHRHRGLEHRHGRPGDDRGRRPRRVPARGDRPDATCRCPTAWSTSPWPTRPRRSPWPSSTSSYFQGPRARLGRAPTSGCCARIIPENRLRVYDVRRGDRDAGRHRLGARAAPRLRPRHGHRARPHRGPAARRRSPTTRRTSAAPSTATAPTRPPASCSCATPSTCPILFLCDTPGIMVGPEAEKTALVRHCRRMFVTGASLTVPVLHDRAAQGLRPRRAGDGRRQLQGAVVHRVAGRPASSAAWASRARSSSATATSWRPSTDPAERKALFEEMVAPLYEHGKAVNVGVATSRSTT